MTGVLRKSPLKYYNNIIYIMFTWRNDGKLLCVHEVQGSPFREKPGVRVFNNFLSFHAKEVK